MRSRLKLVLIDIISVSIFYGGCSQVVKAVGCDSTIRRFNSGHSPYFKHLKIKSKKNQIYKI